MALLSAWKSETLDVIMGWKFAIHRHLWAKTCIRGGYEALF